MEVEVEVEVEVEEVSGGEVAAEVPWRRVTWTAAWFFAI